MFSLYINSMYSCHMVICKETGSYLWMNLVLCRSVDILMMKKIQCPRIVVEVWRKKIHEEESFTAPYTTYWRTYEDKNCSWRTWFYGENWSSVVKEHKGECFFFQYSKPSKLYMLDEAEVAKVYLKKFTDLVEIEDELPQAYKPLCSEPSWINMKL